MSSILLQYSKIENFSKNFFEKITTKKMDRVARRGPLAQAPGALKSHNAEKLKGGTLRCFSTSILSQNMKKLKKKILYFREKISQCRKKQRGTLWDFPTSILSQNIKKRQGGPFGKKSSEKNVSQCRKKLKGGTLWSRPVWYVTRKNRLGQIVQFGAIIFCRTFKNYFGQFVWIEKKESL